MAQRRMFSNRIANSARFLQMPADAQLLYFHMILRADDDGVVEAYPITKLINSAPDSFKVLIGKGFIQQLNEDQVVVIRDWTEHNKIRPDRKTDSLYKSLLEKQCPGIELIKAQPRSAVKDNSSRVDGGLSTDSLREGRVGKFSKEKEGNSSFKKPYFDGQEMRKKNDMWWVIPKGGGAWLEFAGKEKDIEWK